MCIYKILFTGRLSVLVTKTLISLGSWVTKWSAMSVVNCLVSKLVVYLIDWSSRYLCSVGLWNSSINSTFILAN